MTDSTILTTAVLQQLVRIADALEKLAAGGAPVAPDYQRAIDDYPGFDWAGIGATVVAADDDGPTHVEHGGYLYQRRAPVNKFEPAIWYSRAAGKDEQGEVVYARLITFKAIKPADPLPRGLGAQLHNAPQGKPAAKTDQQPQPKPAPAAARASQPTSQPTAPAVLPTSQPTAPAAQQLPNVTGLEPAGVIHKPGAVKSPVNYRDYYATATSKSLGLTRPEALAIAQALGITQPTAESDFARPMAALWYFAEAKGTYKLDLQTAINLYLSCSNDPDRAVIALRERFEPAF